MRHKSGSSNATSSSWIMDQLAAGEGSTFASQTRAAATYTVRRDPDFDERAFGEKLGQRCEQPHLYGALAQDSEHTFGPMNGVRLRLRLQQGDS